MQKYLDLNVPTDFGDSNAPNERNEVNNKNKIGSHFYQETCCIPVELYVFEH